MNINTAKFVLDIIGGKSLTLDEIMKIGKNNGYTRDQINETIELLLDNGYIYEPISGHFRKNRDLEGDEK